MAGNDNWTELVLPFPCLWNPQDPDFSNEAVKAVCREQLLGICKQQDGAPVDMESLKQWLAGIVIISPEPKSQSAAEKLLPANILPEPEEELRKVSRNVAQRKEEQSVATRREIIMKFDDFLKEFPCLWDPKDINYKDNNMRASCTQKLLERFNSVSNIQITKSDVRRKLRTLHQRQKRRHKMTSGEELLPVTALSKDGQSIPRKVSSNVEQGMPKFDDLLKEFPCLWDPDDINYTDNNMRASCMQTLLDKFNSVSNIQITKSDVRRKLNTFHQRQKRRHQMTSKEKVLPVTALSEDGQSIPRKVSRNGKQGMHKLDHLVKEFPCLWNPDDINYTDNIMRASCMQTLLDKFNSVSNIQITKSDMRRKLKAFHKRQKTRCRKHKLDDFVKEFPCLWDPDDINYKDNNMRASCMQKLLERFNSVSSIQITKADMTRKLKTFQKRLHRRHPKTSTEKVMPVTALSEDGQNIPRKVSRNVERGMHKLDDLVKEFPCLWDPDDLNYKDNNMRARCMQKLLERFNSVSSIQITKADMTRKLKTFQKRLHRHHPKLKAAGSQKVHETTEKLEKAIGAQTQLQEMTAGQLEANGGQKVRERTSVLGNTTGRQTQLQEMTAGQLEANGGQKVRERTSVLGNTTGRQTQLQEMTAGQLEANGGQKVRERTSMLGNTTGRQTQLQEMTAGHLADGGQKEVEAATAGQLKAVEGQRESQKMTEKHLKALGGQRQTRKTMSGQLKATGRQKISVNNFRALFDIEADPKTNSDDGVQFSCRSQEAIVLPGVVVSFGYCRFCGELKRNCSDATKENKLYIANNTCKLTVNDLSVELDFSDDKPTTVCEACDKKLKDIIEFVKRVKESQVMLSNFHKAVGYRKPRRGNLRTVNNKELAMEVSERRKRNRITIDLNPGNLPLIFDDVGEINASDINYDEDISSVNDTELVDKVSEQSNNCIASVDSDSPLPSLCEIEMESDSVSFTEFVNEKSEQVINSVISINSSPNDTINDNSVEMSRGGKTGPSYLNTYTDFLTETVNNDATNNSIEDSVEPITFNVHHKPTKNTESDDDEMIIDVKKEDETADDIDNEAQRFTYVIYDDIDIKEEDIEMAIDARKKAQLNYTRIEM